MDSRQIDNEINAIFRRILKNENLELDGSMTAKDVPGWDSLSNMLLVAEVEKFFGIRFSFREIMKFRNLGDLYSAVETKL